LKSVTLDLQELLATRTLLASHFVADQDQPRWFLPAVLLMPDLRHFGTDYFCGLPDGRSLR
jgi:hypothetical protein